MPVPGRCCPSRPAGAHRRAIHPHSPSANPQGSPSYSGCSSYGSVDSSTQVSGWMCDMNRDFHVLNRVQKKLGRDVEPTELQDAIKRLEAIGEQPTVMQLAWALGRGADGSSTHGAGGLGRGGQSPTRTTPSRLGQPPSEEGGRVAASRWGSWDPLEEDVASSLGPPHGGCLPSFHKAQIPALRLNALRKSAHLASPGGVGEAPCLLRLPHLVCFGLPPPWLLTFALAAYCKLAHPPAHACILPTYRPGRSSEATPCSRGISCCTWASRRASRARACRPDGASSSCACCCPGPAPAPWCPRQPAPSQQRARRCGRARGRRRGSWRPGPARGRTWARPARRTTPTLTTRQPQVGAGTRAWPWMTLPDGCAGTRRARSHPTVPG
jgi:hypothetical protein